MSLKRINIDQQAFTATKRSILKIVSTMFDTLGLFAPVPLKGKLFMQTLWEHNIDWDETISKEQCSVWNDIVEEYKKIHTLEVRQRGNGLYTCLFL